MARERDNKYHRRKKRDSGKRKNKMQDRNDKKEKRDEIERRKNRYMNEETGHSRDMKTLARIRLNKERKKQCNSNKEAG